MRVANIAIDFPFYFKTYFKRNVIRKESSFYFEVDCALHYNNLYNFNVSNKFTFITQILK